jgi:hypothetical protein
LDCCGRAAVVGTRESACETKGYAGVLGRDENCFAGARAKTISEYFHG